MPASLIQSVRTAENLPPLPTLAVEVLKLNNAPGASANDLARIVSRDPVMTAKVLRLVNSPLFGVATAVTSVKQAISLLGMRSVTVTILSLALVGAMQESMPPGGSEGLDLDAFWRRSLGSATAAKLLAAAVAPGLSGDAFVAGLLCDLGVLAAARVDPARYGPVLREAAASGRRLEDLERERLGVTHAALGRELLTVWNLPALLCDAVGAHHEGGGEGGREGGDGLESLPEGSRPLALLVRAGAAIAALFAGDLAPTELERVKARCVADAGVSAQTLDEILRSMDTQLRDAAKLMGVAIGETANYARLRAGAAATLARLSVEAEADRARAVNREAAVLRENQRLRADHRAVLEAASVDGLTKTANRSAFDQRLEEDVRRAAAGGPGERLALIMIDIDHFKTFNDEYGHQAGDEVLRRVAARIAVSPNQLGFVARYGGEEFAVIVPGAGRDDAVALAEKIRANIEQTPLGVGPRRLSVTASLGVACLGDFRVVPTSAQLVNLADRCLYEAKRRGRNRTVCTPAARPATPPPGSLAA